VHGMLWSVHCAWHVVECACGNDLARQRPPGVEVTVHLQVCV